MLRCEDFCVLPQQAKTNLNNSINDKANGGHKWNPQIWPREQREESGMKKKSNFDFNY